MKTTIEEILNSTLVGKTITIYINDFKWKKQTSTYTTTYKTEHSTQTHKRVIESVGTARYDDDCEITLGLNERILDSMTTSFNVHDSFEIEDTPIPIYTAEDNDPWKSGPYDSL